MQILAFLLAVGLALSAFAQDSKPGEAKPATPPPTATPVQAIPIPPQPPAKPPVPVPDLPIVQKSEVEGIIIEDMKVGDGDEVKPGAAVYAYYHGTLKEGGKIFDSAFDRGEPVAYSLSQVVPGWQKGIPGMKVGGIRRLTIPAALAYGERGRGALIPPNSDLVFVIQILDILRTEDIKEGQGEPASNVCVAATTYTIKDADGKEIEKVDAANPYIWIPNEYLPVQFGVEGMRVGGKRKLIVPKEMNQPGPNSPPEATRPFDVPVTIEIELIALRNLPRR